MELPGDDSFEPLGFGGWGGASSFSPSYLWLSAPGSPVLVFRNKVPEVTTWVRFRVCACRHSGRALAPDLRQVPETLPLPQQKGAGRFLGPAPVETPRRGGVFEGAWCRGAALSSGPASVRTARRAAHGVSRCERRSRRHEGGGPCPFLPVGPSLL